MLLGFTYIDENITPRRTIPRDTSCNLVLWSVGIVAIVDPVMLVAIVVRSQKWRVVE